MNSAWIEITDASGVRYGDGPIVSAQSWRSEPALNRAGTWEFVIPASDPRADEIADHRYAYCHVTLSSATRALWGGRIERCIYGAGPDGQPVLTVSGSDLLRELVDVSVHDLALFDTVTVHPDSCSKEIASPPSGDELSDALDGSVGDTTTSETLQLNGDDIPGQWLYLRHATQFHGVQLTIGAGVNNNVTELRAQYYNGAAGGWEAVRITSDGTAAGGAPFAQDGVITWEIPQGWALYEDTYQLRIYPAANLDAIDLSDAAIIYFAPTATALSKIAAFFPAGWTFDTTNGYDATADTVYLQMAGESVLEALIRVSEQTGENFRLGADRAVLWQRDDTPAAGIRAFGPLHPGADVSANADICVIIDLEEIQDAYDLVSRVYPIGGGEGASAVKLAATTRSAPTGYTLDTTANYLKRDAAETVFGRIERRLSFPDINAADASDQQHEYAANALFDAAYQYLVAHSATNNHRITGNVPRAFKLTVEKTAALLYPGTILPVYYRRLRDSYVVALIDAQFWILSAQHTLTDDGAYTTALMVSSVAHDPENDDNMLAEQVRLYRKNTTHAPAEYGLEDTSGGTPVSMGVRAGRIASLSKVQGFTTSVDTNDDYTLVFVGGVLVDAFEI